MEWEDCVLHIKVFGQFFRQWFDIIFKMFSPLLPLDTLKKYRGWAQVNRSTNHAKYEENTGVKTGESVTKRNRRVGTVI